ncbi:MAG: hypothetical protein ACE5I1_20955, partial [bacterium]
RLHNRFQKFYRNALWGHFDIDCVYAAHGAKWLPLVENGRLDLRYEPNTTQWLDGLSDTANANKHVRKLKWLSPFDFSDILIHESTSEQKNKAKVASTASPTLQMVLQAFLLRAGQLLGGRRNPKASVGQILREEEQPLFLDALEKAGRAKCQHDKLQAVPALWPGQRIGSQIYKTIHPQIIRYLQFASILNVGKQALYGCGRFYLS